MEFPNRTEQLNAKFYQFQITRNPKRNFHLLIVRKIFWLDFLLRLNFINVNKSLNIRARQKNKFYY